ncbi:MAG: hypothetical protein R6U03_13685 [Gillisia sp.]
MHAHLAVVEACAPRGIDVMVEKPLAVNMKHARRMAELLTIYSCCRQFKNAVGNISTLATIYHHCHAFKKCCCQFIATGGNL